MAINENRNIQQQLDGGEIVRSITVQLMLEFSGEQTNTVLFEDVTFNQPVIFKNFSGIYLIRFVKCTFKKSFRIHRQCNLWEVMIKDSTFESTCEIEGSIIGHIALSNKVFKKGIKIEDVISKRILFQGNSTDNGKVRIIRNEINLLSINTIRDNTDIIISSYDSNLQAFSKGGIDTLSFVADSQYKGQLIVAGMPINVLTLNGHNGTGRLLFQKLEIGNLNIDQFTYSGLLSFANIETGLHSIIQCHNSNLGKCEIYDVNFRNFKNIIIDNSNIQDIVATNVAWCNELGTNMSGNDNRAHLRETYRQLKNVMIRQNDKVQELNYHRLEMDTLLEALRERKINRGDRFIIWTNKMSNGHGLDWAKSFYWIMGLTLMAYTINKWLLGYTHFDWKMVPKDMALFIESINPVRKYSAIYDETNFIVEL